MSETGGQPRSRRQLLGEELIGAELIASRELAQGAGSLLDALERGNAIRERQLGYLFNDYASYLDDVVASPFTWPRAAAALLARRAAHVGEGVQETVELVRDELAPLRRAWDGFFEVVRRDWRN